MFSKPARRLASPCVLLLLSINLLAGQPEVTPADQTENVKALIAKLNAPDNISREDAEQSLLKIGQPALSLLKEATKSTEPETAARAKRLVGKMMEAASRPTQSYSDVMPEDSIFFLEAPNTRQTLDKMKLTPLGRFWDSPATQKFYKGHHDSQVPNDQKLLDAIREIPKLLDGKALFALGSPDTAEAAELDPPLIYVFETKQSNALEAKARELFTAMSDPSKGVRRYGPFSIEEHITAQSVYGQESFIHSLTQKGMESFLDTLVKRPEKTLSPLLKDIRALMPQYDFVYHISADGFPDLADAGQLVDDQILEVVETLGFVKGSAVQGALKLNGDGIEEYMRLTLGGDERNDGLVAVFKKMASQVPPPPDANAEQALNLIPWQAGFLVSFNGDVAKNAAALSKAISAIDSVLSPAPENRAAAIPNAKGQPNPPKVPQPNGMKPPANAPGTPIKPGVNPNAQQPNAVKPADPFKAAQGAAPDANQAATQQPPPSQPKPANGMANQPKTGATRAQQALAAGNPDAVNPVATAPSAAPTTGQAAPPATAPKLAGAKDAPAADKREAKKTKPQVTPQHVTKFEKIGLKLEQFLEQVDGSIQLGLFLQQIEGEVPDDLPVVPLIAVKLKDSKVVEQALDAACAGAEPRFTKEVLNGGNHYVEKDGDEDAKPGFWMKGNYLAYSGEGSLIELASAALIHKQGNERFSDRADYKQSVLNKNIDPQALLSIFGDAEQIMEMPYKLAKENWQEDEANPWPDYEVIRPLVHGKSVHISFKSIPEGLQAHAQTPLSIMGMIEIFRRNFIEAGFW